MERVLARLACMLMVAGATVLLTSCSNMDDFCLFGYSTAKQYRRDIKTVQVPVFKNKTFVRGIEFELTEAVIKEIEKKTPWKVVADNADAVVIGTVIDVRKRIVVNNPLDEVRDAELTLAAEIIWLGRDGKTVSAAETPPADALAPIDPLAARLGPPAPVLVSRTASFVPELGQSVATARKAAVDDLAEQIVSMMEKPW